MRPFLGLALLPVVSGLWSISDFAGWYFSLGHVCVVDVVGQNILMRMGNPTVYGLHGPVLSHTWLQEALKSAGGTLFPSGDIEVVDVTLLTKEQRVIRAEEQGFQSSLVQWPMVGVTPDIFAGACDERDLPCPSSRQPGRLVPAVRQRLAADFQQWDRDELESRVVALRSILEGHGKDGAARVVFFHCLCGCDRTGQLFAAYAMRYRNMSLTEALAENELVAGRHMYYQFQAGAQWYCENLRTRGLYDHNDCDNCGPYRCHDTGIPLDPIFLYAFCCLAAASITALCIGACWYQEKRRRWYLETNDNGYLAFAA